MATPGPPTVTARRDNDGATVTLTLRGALCLDMWLHVDLDVLDRTEFRACGAANDPSMLEGLTWAQLAAVTRTALQTDGCRGWSVGVYNSDLDPEGREGQRIVAYLAEATRDGGAGSGM
jgi:arginase family enzyme